MPLLLGFSAFMLERAFRATLLTAEEDALLTHTYSMMALAEPEEGFLLLPEKLTDSRFNDPNSGLYAQVVDDDYGAVWQSISLQISPYNGEVPIKKVALGQIHIEEVAINREPFFMSRFNTVWEIENQDREYQFTVIHSQENYHKEILSYRTTLASWLGGLALLLIFTQTLIIRWGLQPLRRLASDIKQLEAGDIETLNQNYPDEILPVTQNINHLLASENTQRKRYKNTLNDLAHSLKTPLTVIRATLNNKNDTYEASFNVIDEQVERMNNIVTHQLNRASANVTKTSFQALTPLAPLIQRISSALGKVYQEKTVRCISHVDDNTAYPAPADDLMELLGNLLENAYKYGNSQVVVKASRDDKQLHLSVEDDGNGIPEAVRNDILQRGARADTSTPGQGIGLAITTDLISTYGGGLRVDASELGGAKFHVSLPLQ